MAVNSLNSQSFSTLGASAVEDIPAALGGHAYQESMGSFSLGVAERGQCLFHFAFSKSMFDVAALNHSQDNLSSNMKVCGGEMQRWLSVQAKAEGKVSFYANQFPTIFPKNLTPRVRAYILPRL
jgi:hypothetical protein